MTAPEASDGAGHEWIHGNGPNNGAQGPDPGHQGSLGSSNACSSTCGLAGPWSSPVVMPCSDKLMGTWTGMKKTMRGVLWSLSCVLDSKLSTPGACVSS